MSESSNTRVNEEKSENIGGFSLQKSEERLHKCL